MIADYFFAPYLPPQELRRQAALRDGVFHGGQIVPHDPLPGQPVTLVFEVNASLPLDVIAVYYTIDGALPEGEHGLARSGQVEYAIRVQDPPVPASADGTSMPVCLWHALIPAQADGTVVRYRGDAWSAADPALHRWVGAVDPIGAPPVGGRLFAYSVDTYHAPAWLADAMIYQIFVDRFASAVDQPPLRDPGSLMDYFGGTLRGITAHLDYIQALGANVVWLSPIFESPTYHGYNPTSFDIVARRYGTNADLHQLIAAAHGRGMRVILDFVANHIADEHPLFLLARADPSSPAAQWFTFDPAFHNGYLAYAGVKNMPTLTTERPDVQAYLIAAARSWLDDVGADGLRLDNVSGPPHAFWSIFQHGVKQGHPQALTLGEVSGGMGDIVSYAGRMDGFMDFPLIKQMRRAFAQRDLSLQAFLAYLDQHAGEIPVGMASAIELDNHDMHRFLWLAEGDRARLRLAALCQMTLAGTPIIYYGTEVGLSQRAGPPGQDSYAREPMVWGDAQDQSLLAFYQAIIALRADSPVFRYGHFAAVPVRVMADEPRAAQHSGAYARWTADDCAVVALNNSDHAVIIQIDLAMIAQITGHTRPHACDLLFTIGGRCEVATTDGIVTIELPAMDGVVLRLG